MNTPRLLLSILLVFIFAACHRLQSDKGSLSFTQFPDEENITFETFVAFSKGKITNLFLYDTVLLARNSKKTVKDYFVYSYGLKSRTMLDSIFKLGSDKNQVLTPFSTGLYQGILWTQDVSTKRILLERLSTKMKEEYSLKLPLYSMQMADSLQFYANGYYEKDSKIHKIDLISGKIVKSFGKYGKEPDGIPKMAWRTANESFLFLKPDNKKLVLAYRYTDKIEIFDLTTLKSKTISGPEKFDIAFKPLAFYGRTISERTEDTKFAFVGGSMSEKYIYLLFSGNNHQSEHIDFGKFIFVYDWDGNPVRKINLPNYVSCFVVSNDQELFVFDVKESQIKKADLKK